MRSPSNPPCHCSESLRALPKKYIFPQKHILMNLATWPREQIHKGGKVYPVYRASESQVATISPTSQEQIKKFTFAGMTCPKSVLETPGKKNGTGTYNCGYRVETE